MEEERDETRADWLHWAPHRHCEIRTDTGNTGLNMEMSFFSSCFCLSLSFLLAFSFSSYSFYLLLFTVDFTFLLSLKVKQNRKVGKINLKDYPPISLSVFGCNASCTLRDSDESYDISNFFSEQFWLCRLARNRHVIHQVVSWCSTHLAITMNLETLISLIYIELFAMCSHLWSAPTHVCSAG